MSLTKYYNLLIFHETPTSASVIGEDGTITSFATNTAEVGLAQTQLDDYVAALSNIQSLTISFKALSTLPPGNRLVSLIELNANGCTNITHVPTSYNAGLVVLNVASTKLSSVPSSFTSLMTLDITNCRRIASVAIPTLTTLVMSHSSVTELTNISSLIRLIALNTRIASIPPAPALVTVVWSPVSASNTLTIDSANTALVSVLVVGHDSHVVTTPNGVVNTLAL